MADDQQDAVDLLFDEIDAEPRALLLVVTSDKPLSAEVMNNITESLNRLSDALEKSEGRLIPIVLLPPGVHIDAIRDPVSTTEPANNGC